MTGDNAGRPVRRQMPKYTKIGTPPDPVKIQWALPKTKIQKEIKDIKIKIDNRAPEASTTFLISAQLGQSSD